MSQQHAVIIAEIQWIGSVVVSCVAYVDGLVQDCSISSALAMEILQFCSKPSMWSEDSVMMS